MMKRLSALLLAAMLLAACQGPLETPQVATLPDTPPPSASPSPSPTPMPEYEARLRSLQQEIEALLPGSAFRDMNEEEMAQYTEPFGGDFQGIGRVWGEQAYVLLEPVEPPPEGLCYMSNGERHDPGEEYPVIEIGLFSVETGFEEPMLYTMRNVNGVLFQGYTSQVALLVNCGDALTAALSPHSRHFAHLARARGLLTDWERPDGEALTLWAFDMELYHSVGTMSSAKYFIPLTPQEQVLIERAIEARVIAGGSDAFATGFFFELQAPDNPGLEPHAGYQMLSDGRFVQGWRHQMSAVYESPELAEFFQAKIMEVFGYDPYSFSMDDFSQIVRAEFTFPDVIHASQGEFTAHVLEDAADLARLGEILSSGQHLYRGGSACSFHSALVLTLEDGREITINIATDGCRTSLIDGRIALEDYDKAALLELFGIEEKW